MKIHESGENYLETILILTTKNGYVRSIDIAKELNFTKASVSRAMSILKKEDYIVMEPTGNITLTSKGKERAEKIYERHRLIAEFLTKVLGVNKNTADADACRIEHVISAETFTKIKEHIDNK